MPPLPEYTQRFSPTQGTFSGHETFPFRYSWLKKGIEGLLSNQNIFNSEDAIVDLGVGKNMVRAIRHWSIATKLVDEGGFFPGRRTRELTVSPLGLAMFVEPGFDVFMEDDATLWLLHWLLATNEFRATTWYYAFSVFREREFTLDDIAKGLGFWLESHQVKVSASTLKSDVSCFIRTYAAVKRGPASTSEETLECPLTNLNLLSVNSDDKGFRFQNGRKSSLPSAIFAFALMDCWLKRHSTQATLSVREITHGEGSPGRVFCLDDDAVLEYLDDLGTLTKNRLTFSDSVLIRQVIRNSEFAPEELINDYYSD